MTAERIWEMEEEERVEEAGREAELPSIVQLYLQDIGRVPLLTREQEYELFRRAEAGRYVLDIIEGLHRRDGVSPSDEALLTELVRRLERGLHVAAAVDLVPAHASLAEVLSAPSLREAIDGTPAPEIIAEGARRTGWRTEDVEHALWELSVISCLLPAAFLERVELAARTAGGPSLADWVHHVDCAAAALTVRHAIRQGDDALQQVVRANLRLVVKIAKSYSSRSVPLLDLVQEGNTGLMTAARKFEYRRGYRFTTYATWWIRQTVGRALINQERLIRLPIHISEQVSRYKRVRAELMQQKNREPSYEEISDAMGISMRRVKRLAASAAQTPVSLETPVGEDGEASLVELMESVQAPSPEEETTQAMMIQEVRRALKVLTQRERSVVGLRYGLDDGESRTLQEVGEALGLTRERVRQIEHNALRKLRRVEEGLPVGSSADGQS